MEQIAMELAGIVVEPALQGLTVITLGGSHRARKRAVEALRSASIRQRWLGPVAMYSKRHNYAIPTADVAKALALNVGITRPRDQGEWPKGVDPDTYFGKEERQ